MFSFRVISGVFLTLCIIFAATLGTLIFVTRERTNDIINELTVDRVMASEKGLTNYLNDLTNYNLMRASVLASQKRLIDAINEYAENDYVLTDENYEIIEEILNEFIYGYDFISVTDANGIALARTDSGERVYPLPKNGYSLMENPDVKQVFATGRPVTALTFMLDNTTLVATALCPIYDGDKLIGNVTCLYDLTNPKYIIAYKEQSGSEAAIFLGHEEFISTLAYAENPVHLIAHDDVINAIFEKGESTYVSFTSIGDTTYGTVFSPFIYHGEIVGMLFSGVDVQNALAIRTGMDTLILVITSLFLVIAIIFIVIIQRFNMMITRQMDLQNIMTNISQSFLSDKDLDVLITDAFNQLGSYMRISQILMFKPKFDEDRHYVCTNEWTDPALNLPTRIGYEVAVSDALRNAFNYLRDNSKSYISSDNVLIRDAMSPYREDFKNFIATAIVNEKKTYAVLDFSKNKKYKKWRRDDINAAVYITNILTGAVTKKAAEEQLVLAKEVAERSSQYKTSFLANVSHEIRTPMNAILGITEIYLQDPSAQSNINEGLGIIYDSGNLLLGIINDILDLSKIEAGKMEINSGKYDIPSLINDVAQICRLRYGSKPIEFIIDLDKNTPLNLLGDELRIRQILTNILSNAFKYTDKGKIEMSVSATQPDTAESTKAVSDETVLIFRVKDTGQGMTEDQLERLFDEFTRFNTDVNITTVGTGLGMSITKQLIELMDGDIQIGSMPGKGTTVTVYLPQKRTDATVCGPEISEKLNSFSFHSMSVTRKSQVVCEYMPYGSVLVVDDVDSNLYVSKGMLIPYGLQISTATSGFEAIDYIASGKNYDVIFMDHMMPKMDGIETTRNLREMGYSGHIIALTANALVGQAEIFLENGFDGYISKPIDTRELNAILNEFIRDKKPPEVVRAARKEAREAELLKMLEASQEQPSGPLINEVNEHFILDAEKAIDIMSKEHSNIASGADADIDMYRITVHGMKSALRSIGEEKTSELAYTLEKAAQENDLETIIAMTTEFIYKLKALVDNMRK